MVLRKACGLRGSQRPDGSRSGDVILSRFGGPVACRSGEQVETGCEKQRFNGSVDDIDGALGGRVAFEEVLATGE